MSEENRVLLETHLVQQAEPAVGLVFINNLLLSVFICVHLWCLGRLTSTTHAHILRPFAG
jgi:hypothetical protein